MEEIKIQKQKAIKREKIMRWSWLFIGTIIWFLILNGGYNFVQLMSFGENYGWKFPFLTYSFIFMAIWEYIFYQLFLLKINSLEYFIDEEKGRLLSSWKVILKYKNTAKLQVINSVDIRQDIWDKFLDLYNVEVCYGFSEEGYYHSFNYLSEKDAEDILEKIKPSGKSKIEIE